MRPIDADALKKRAIRASTVKLPHTFFKAVGTREIDKAPTIEQPTWISCAERLPLYNERVLAYVCGRIEPLTLFYRDLLVEDYWEDDVGRVIRLGAVTHWMPLPEPPKGDE